jgi:uncharacterized cupin superfamily protein
MKLHQLAPAPPGEWEPIPADRLVHGSPATRTWVQYEDGPTKLSVGLWEATPGKWRIAYAEWEFVEVISGHCILAGDDGSRIEAGPGASFVIEPGFTGTWDVTAQMTKRWVIRE